MSQMNKGLANQNIVILRRMLNVVALTIPKHILDEMDWREGELVRITKDGKRLIVERGQISFETNVTDESAKGEVHGKLSPSLGGGLHDCEHLPAKDSSVQKDGETK